MHSIRKPDSAHASNLTSTGHDHAQRDRDEIETFTDSGTLDFVIEGGAYSDLSIRYDD